MVRSFVTVTDEDNPAVFHTGNRTVLVYSSLISDEVKCGLGQGGEPGSLCGFFHLTHVRSDISVEIIPSYGLYVSDWLDWLTHCLSCNVHSLSLCRERLMQNTSIVNLT
jgi:hypothetical protein